MWGLLIIKILITICARKGSKRVKNKNIRDFIGKPLITHTIDIAKKWGRADKIVVSTDSEEIARISEEHGAEIPFMRPKELSSDISPKLPVIKHAIEYLKNEHNQEYDLVVDLDPTSPLRIVNDIENAYNIMIQNQPFNLFSVCSARKNPYFNMVELNKKGYAHLCKKLKNPVFRMQDTPKVYELNASIYMYWANHLIDMDNLINDGSMIFEMPPERSIDIDSEFDFKLAEFFFKMNKTI